MSRLSLKTKIYNYIYYFSLLLLLFSFLYFFFSFLYFFHIYSYFNLKLFFLTGKWFFLPHISPNNSLFTSYLYSFIFFFKYFLFYFYSFIIFPLNFWYDFFCNERYSILYYIVGFFYFIFLFNILFLFFSKIRLLFYFLFNFILDFKDLFFTIIVYRAFSFVFFFFGFLRAFYDTDFEHYFETTSSYFFDASAQIWLKRWYNILYFKLNFFYYFVSSCFYSIFRLNFLCFIFIFNYFIFIFNYFIFYCVSSNLFFFIYFFTFLKLFFSSFIGFFFWKLIYFVKRIYLFFVYSDWTWGFFFEFYRNLDESWFRRPYYTKIRKIIIPGLPDSSESATYLYNYKELKLDFSEPETELIRYRFDNWLNNYIFDTFFEPWDSDDLSYLDHIYISYKRKKANSFFFKKTYADKNFYYPYWFFEDILDSYRPDYYNFNLDKYIFSKQKSNRKWNYNAIKKPLTMDFSLSLQKDLDVLDIGFSLMDYKTLKEIHLLDNLPFSDDKINNYKLNSNKVFASSFLDFSSLSDPLLTYHSNFFSQELDHASWSEDQNNHFDTTDSTLEDDLVDFVFIFDFFKSFRSNYIDAFILSYKKFNPFYLFYSFIFYILYFIFYIFIYNPLFFFKTFFYYFFKLRFNLINIYFYFVNSNFITFLFSKIFVKIFNVLLKFSLLKVLIFILFFFEFIFKLLKFFFLFIYRYRFFIVLIFIFLFFGIKIIFFFFSIFFSFWSNALFEFFCSFFTSYPLSSKTLFYYLNDTPYWKYAYKVAAYNVTLYRIFTSSWIFWSTIVSNFDKIEWLVLASHTYFYFKIKIFIYSYLINVPAFYYYYLLVFQIRFDFFIFLYYLRLFFFFFIYCFSFYFWYITNFFFAVWNAFIFVSIKLYPSFFINFIASLFEIINQFLNFLYLNLIQFLNFLYLNLIQFLNFLYLNIIQFLNFLYLNLIQFLNFDFFSDFKYWYNYSFFSFSFHFYFFYSFFDFFNYSLNGFNLMFFLYSLKKYYFFYVILDFNNSVFFELYITTYWLWFKTMSQFEFWFYDTDLNPLSFLKYNSSRRYKGNLDLFWFKFHRVINSIERFNTFDLNFFRSFRSPFYYKAKSFLNYHYHHLYFYFDRFWIIFYFILFYIIFLFFYFFSTNFRASLYRSTPNSVEYLWKIARSKKSLFYTLEYQMDLRIFFAEKVNFGFNISKYLNKKLGIDFSDIFIDNFSDVFFRSTFVKNLIDIINYFLKRRIPTGSFSFYLSWDQFRKNRIMYFLNKSLRFSLLYSRKNREIQDSFIFTFRKLREETIHFGLTYMPLRKRLIKAKNLLFLEYKPDIADTQLSTARNLLYFFKIWKFSEYFFSLKGKPFSFFNFTFRRGSRQPTFFRIPGIFSWYQNHLVTLNIAKLKLLHENRSERRFWLWSMYKLDKYLDIFMAYHPLEKMKDKGMFVDDFFYSSPSKELRNDKFLNIYNYYLPLLFSANFTFFNFYKKVKYISDLPDFFYYIDDPFYENFFFNLLVAPRTFYMFLDHCMRTRMPYLGRLARLQIHLNGDMWPIDKQWNHIMERDSMCHKNLFDFFYYFEQHYNWDWLPDWLYHKSSVFNYHSFNDAFLKYYNFYSVQEEFGFDSRFWNIRSNDEYYIMRPEEAEEQEDDIEYYEDDLIFIYWFLIPFFSTGFISFYVFSSGFDVQDEDNFSHYLFLYQYFFDNFFVNFYFPILEVSYVWFDYLVNSESSWGTEIPTINSHEIYFLRNNLADLSYSATPAHMFDYLVEMEENDQIENDPVCKIDTITFSIFFFKKWFFNDSKYIVPYIDIIDDYSFFSRYTYHPESFIYFDDKFHYNKYPFSFYIYNSSEWALDNKGSGFVDIIFSGPLYYLSFLSSIGFSRWEIGFPFKHESLRESFPLISFCISFLNYAKHVYIYFFYTGLSFYVNFNLFFYNVLCLDDCYLLLFLVSFLIVLIIIFKNNNYLFSKRVKNLNYDTVLQLKFYLRLKRKLRDLYK